MVVKLYTIDPKRRIPFKQAGVILLLWTLAFLLMLVTGGHSLAIALSFITIVITTVTFVNLNWYRRNGHLLLSEGLIEFIDSTGKDSKFQITSLDKLRIRYREIEGDHRRPFSMKIGRYEKGVNNYLTIWTGNSSVYYEFLLRKSNVSQINALIRNWREQSLYVEIADHNNELVDWIYLAR